MAHFHASNLVNLGKTPERVASDLAPRPGGVPAGPSMPVYPYGTCISLCDDVLAKVMPGGELPPAGAYVHGCFVGMVKAVSPGSERIDGDGKRTVSGATVEIEIQDLGFAAEDAVDRQQEVEQKQLKTWYGSKKPDSGEE
jgi:hypothetical protein